MTSRLYLTTTKPEAHHIASILDAHFEEQAVSTALFEAPESAGLWCWSVYTEEPQTTREEIRERLGGDCFGLTIEEEVFGDVDWVSQTLRDLTPVEAGRFFLHGSHDRHRRRPFGVNLEIDAGQAFGTGHHGTTAGCLDMLERVLRQRRPKRAYDIGTGTGVLAIALARAAATPCLATDIDSVSVKVARENARQNGALGFLSFETAAGFNHPAFAKVGKADLVFANILARPLEKLSAPMARHLAPEADVILSGLLPHQKARIVSAYRRQGLVLKRAHLRDDWLTLWMRRP